MSKHRKYCLIFITVLLQKHSPYFDSKAIAISHLKSLNKMAGSLPKNLIFSDILQRVKHQWIAKSGHENCKFCADNALPSQTEMY